MKFIKDFVIFITSGLQFQAQKHIERAMLASFVIGLLSFGFLAREDIASDLDGLLNLNQTPQDIAFMIGVYCLILQFSFIWLLAKVPNQLNQLAKKNADICANMKTILNQGTRGELLAHGYIEQLRDRMTFIQRGASWSPADNNIKDIVLLDADGQNSQEIDDLLVVDNHILIFEVKDWRGKISPQNEELIVNGNLRKSPHAQTMSKIHRIKVALNKAKVNANIYPIYVFSHPDVELDPNLSFNFVKLEALDTFLKCLREKIWDENVDSLLASEHVYHIKTCLLSLMDNRLDAKHHHMLTLAEKPNPTKELIEYARLSQSLTENNALAKLLTTDYAWNFMQKWMSAIVCFVLLAITFEILLT